MVLGNLNIKKIIKLLPLIFILIFPLIVYGYTCKYNISNNANFVFNSAIKFNDNIVGTIEEDESYQFVSKHLSDILINYFDIKVGSNNTINYGANSFNDIYSNINYNNYNFIAVYIVYLFYVLFIYCIIKLFFALPDWLFHKLNYFIYSGCKK